MISNLHIDWLSITIPIDSEKSVKKLSDMQLWEDLLGGFFTCDVSKWRPTKPLFGYTEAYQSTHGTIAMYGRVEMGLHVIYSGQALQSLANLDVTAERILSNARDRNAKATRVDIAMDTHNGQATVRSYEMSVRNGQCVTSSKSWRVLESGNGGHTLYIGARSSERMVRIYDKKAERAAAFVEVGSDSWIRIEAELKGQQADNFLKATRDNNLHDVMCGHLIATVDFPKIPDWKEATSGQQVVIEPTATKRKDTKTRHWLMKMVAPVVAREAAQDPEFYAALLTEFNAQIEALLRGKSGDIDTDK